ncbi:hypothetical protein FHU41_001513 [Psychromicrobium silvestre]|uniref:Uncharacterized protein n=1 Tax=Psychromicrobium silvestre TaxID=1645614 RepID=A0A7Y9LTH7_9MICC|nr:hypothetical protein [Psychromicrobium silvestre]NYE95292.1 hypothetical protein [Psychromicrobium silvestre]
MAARSRRRLGQGSAEPEFRLFGASRGRSAGASGETKAATSKPEPGAAVVNLALRPFEIVTSGAIAQQSK